MRNLLSLGLIIVVFSGVLYACGAGGDAATEQAAFSGELTALELKVQAQSGTFSTAGQPVAFQYTVRNSGSTVLAGPVTVTDTKGAVTCPVVNTVGNFNNDLDPGETVICVASHLVTQSELNGGSMTSTAGATAGGVNSNVVTTVVQMTLLKVLELTSTASPVSYNNSGQDINFSYIIRNAGTTSLGPAQFVINDDKLGVINCGAQNTLAAGASISCSGVYKTKDTDRTLTELVFNTTASGGGATSIQAVQVKVTNTAVVSNPSTTYTKGSTVKHTVKAGEWVYQIVRCYGADFDAVKSANPQVADLAKVWPGDVLTIPNIGSNGNIFAPDCITYYTAQSGDTWNAVANKYNSRLDVLMAANRGVSLGGGVKLRIPINSASGSPVSGGGSQPIRLNLTAGSKVTNSGTVTVSKVKERYVFTAAQGQTLTANLTAPSGGLELAVLASNGTALKAQSNTLTWSGTIPSNGDYYVDVVNVTSTDRQFSLDLTLAAPPASTEKVVDINAGAADSNPAYLTVFNNALYFSATGMDNTGAELWKYDVATNSISRIKDIMPGATGSNPSYLASYNGALYFGANGDAAGVELWRFNGSDTGRLTDLNGGAGNANPSYMTVFNGYLYFSAVGSDAAGVELWRTDGTNTTRVTDIYSGDGNSNPSYLAVFNNALYFSAISNDGYGIELWKYDGTNLPVRVTDINPGVGNANPAFLVAFNNALYFSANSGDGFGTELWKYDGTNASRAADIYVGAGDSIPSHLFVFNNELYFSANGGTGAGYELWKYNGTAASLVADINKTGDSFPAFLTLYNNHLYFQANGGDGLGRELWRFKGP